MGAKNMKSNTVAVVRNVKNVLSGLVFRFIASRGALPLAMIFSPFRALLRCVASFQGVALG
jgi:hypothetical protein